MKLSPSRRARYLRDTVPIQIGGIAANLARIASCAENNLDEQAISGMLYESKFFIEWAAPGAPIATAAQLAELQCAIARWERHWVTRNHSTDARQSLANFGHEWSNRIIELSGLLNTSSQIVS